MRRLKSENKSKDKSEVKSAIAEGLAEVITELLLYLVLFVIGTLILSLLPFDMSDDSGDLAILIGMIALLAIACIVAMPIYIIKRLIKTKDLRRIHRALGGKYKLTVLTLNKKINGVRRELPAIIGKNSKGKFKLYKNEDRFVFKREYFDEADRTACDIEYPCDESEAIECIEKFMAEEDNNGI